MGLVALVGAGGVVLANDAREDAQYQDLATVTLEQARQYALTDILDILFAVAAPSTT